MGRNAWFRTPHVLLCSESHVDREVKSLFMEKGILVGVRFLDYARNDRVRIDTCHLEPVERSRKFTVTLALPRASHVIQDNAHLLVVAK